MDIKSAKLKTNMYLFEVCITFLSLCTEVANCLPSYHIAVTFVDLHCPGLTFDLGTTRSRLDCSIRCDISTGCRSFFYNGLTTSCAGANLVITSTGTCSSQTGNVYYITTDTTTTTSTTTTSTTTTTTTTLPPTTTTTTTTPPPPPTTIATPLYGTACTSGAQCTFVGNTACLSGTCQCSAGYRLVPATQTCTRNCPSSAYGTTYILISDMALDVTAIGSQTGISVTQCMTYCSGVTSCTGFNFCAACGNMCRLKDGSPLDNPSDWKSQSGVDYYSRNCA